MSYLLAPVKDWKEPGNVKELQSFLGFANFFRRFIKGFAEVAEPLNSLLGSNGKRGKKKVREKTHGIGEKNSV